MVKKNITIDQLAVMIQKGFDKTASVEHVSNEISGLKKWAEGRFDKIEKVILDDHKERIAKLESKVTYLENILNLNIKK
ncbi:MAG: hypothetical protein AAB340_00590 [Patescibacteria group bacterium]